MKRIITIVALAALVACDSATGSDRGARDGGAQEVKAPTTASFSGGASHRAAIASVRKRIAGTPALYEARALVVDGGEVTIEVRSSTTGFNSLTSGTLEAFGTGTGEINKQFQVTAGTRYLVVAYPSSGGGGTLDDVHAHYIEAVP